LASVPRVFSLARLSVIPSSLLFRIQERDMVIPGSEWTDWFPLKLRPRKAGRGRVAEFGRYIRMSIFGPLGSPVKSTETSFRVAMPWSAFVSVECTRNFIFAGRPGLRPYIWVVNNSRISGRRFSRHVLASVTFVPLASVNGSGKVYLGTLASS